MFRAFNHTHLEQWAADTAAPGEQLGVWCLAQGSHLSRGQFLLETRFEPTTRITSPTLYPLGHDCPRGSLALLQERSPFQTNSFDCARALCPPTTTTYSVGRWRRPAVLDPCIRIQMAIYDDTVGLESFMQKANHIAQ